MEGNHPSSINQKLRLPSRKLTYPTLGEGKIIFKSTYDRGYVSSLEGIFKDPWCPPGCNPMTDGIFSPSILRKIGRRYSWILRDSQKIKREIFSAMSRRCLSKHPHLDEGGWHHFSAFQYIKNHHLKMTPRLLDIYWCWFHVHILPSI